MKSGISRWILLIFTFWSLVTVSTQAQTNNDISVFDLVEECDLLAAHPDDPERMAEGVEDDRIVPRLAIMACEDAIERSPDDARFVFQLGRALLAQGKKQDAVKQFQKAAGQGYAAAHAYLGDAYQFGWSVKADMAKAREHYEQAVKGGFETATEQIEQLTFNGSKYVSNTIKALYHGNFDAVKSKSSPQLRNYIFNFTNTLMQECGSFMRPKNIPGFYFYRFPQGASAQNDEDITITMQTSIGEFDAGIFLTNYGCEGPVAQQMFQNMNVFFGMY